MIDSALFASSDDCEGAASTASVTAASTVTDCETLAIARVIGSVTVTPDATFRPVRLARAKPAAATSTEYVPPGRLLAEKRPSAPVAAFRTEPDASFFTATVACCSG